MEALRGMQLQLQPGELRCIIGPNGCGKTTLFNVVSGAFRPTSGHVLLHGRDITGLSPHRIGRLGIMRKFQVPGIYPSLPVAENLEVALLSSSSGMLRRQVERTARLRDLLDRVGLSAKALEPAGTLAHGQKQWLEIAMLLAAHSELLLLDEPTAGMTAQETSATARLIRDLQRERGLAVLAIEHDMNFVRELGCPVTVMLRGAVLFHGSYADVQTDPRVREAYLSSAQQRSIAL
jgi:urea transport system ATP-binding protein